MKSTDFYADFNSAPLYFTPAQACEGSGIQPEMFQVRYVPDRAEPVKIAFDVVSSTIQEVQDAKAPPAVKAKLRALMTALMPALLDYRTALLRLDGEVKSPADRFSTGDQRFLCSWLKDRCHAIFEVIRLLPAGQMTAAALACKPVAVATFERDIDRNANVIRLIPHDQLTQEMCLRAVRKNASSLKWIPGALRTAEVCLAAMQSDQHHLASLKHVPHALRDDAMCRAAVLSNGANILHVPRPNTELCALACIQSGLTWDILPGALRNAEVEYCAALHGYHTKSAERVFGELMAQDPDNAESIARKWEKAYRDRHHPNWDDDELSGLGLCESPRM